MKNKKFWVSLLALIMALVMLLGLIASVIPSANAASSSEIQTQIDALEEEKKALQDKIDVLKGQQKDNLTQTAEIVEQKALIDQQIGLLHEQIHTMNEQIAAYSVLIADKQAELDEAEARLKELQIQNKERIRIMEEQGDLSYWSVIFKASSFSDMLDRFNMIREIRSADKRRMEEMSKAAQEVKETKAVLEEEKAQLEVSRAAIVAAQAELDAQAAASEQLLADLIKKGDEFEDMMDAFEEEQGDLLAELSKKEQEFDEAKLKEHLATATKPTTASSGNAGKPMVDASGLTWLVPVSYRVVSSPYGPREFHPVTGEPNKMHHGVDLAGYDINGKPIVATRAGRVMFAGWYGSGGWTVGIDHGDGFQTYYMHMTSYDVKVGDYVTAGQKIGNVGSTGGSTGPHLHFEIRYNGNSVNPMNYIG